MSSRPLSTRKKSSVSSCLCQTNSPSTFTTMTSQALNCATVRGDQWSENVASFSERSTLSFMPRASLRPSPLQPRRKLLRPAVAVRLRRAGAVIGPLHVNAGPGEAATEGREHELVAGLEPLLVVPQAERNRRVGGVAVFVDRHHHAVHRQAHALGRRLDDALVGLMRHQPVDHVAAQIIAGHDLAGYL